MTGGKNRRLTRFAVLASCTLLFSFASPSKRESARVIRLISGDTLTIQYGGRWEEIKLLGIETPEITMNDKTYEKALENSTTPEEVIRQGREALANLKRYIHYGSQVWLEFDQQKRDRMDRLLGYVFLPNGRMLNEAMLRDGYAIIANFPPNLKYQDMFSSALRQAKNARKGFWKQPARLPMGK